MMIVDVSKRNNDFASDFNVRTTKKRSLIINMDLDY